MQIDHAAGAVHVFGKVRRVLDSLDGTGLDHEKPNVCVKVCS